jgi:lipid II:glycine glycyltransferase (peptidoglycan interpeptide bridge formation enzyme)
VERLETLWSPALSEIDAEAYDRFVATAAGGHYSQTRAWAKVAAASKPCTPIYFLARRNGRPVGAALVLRARIGVPLPFAQVERGPVCGHPDDLPAVLEALLNQSRRHGVLRLSVMPYWTGKARQALEANIQYRGFHNVQSFAGRHARTLRLDLTVLPEDDLFAGSALSKVRHEIRRAERAEATARGGTGKDMDAFRLLHEELLGMEKKAKPGPQWYAALADYFQSDERGAMFVCEHEGRVISAIFMARLGDMATYVIGASSGEELRFPKMILPMAAAIAWAKSNGIGLLDFGGIPMQGDPDAKRHKIAEFKRSFSRAEIDLMHEHVRWF